MVLISLASPMRQLGHGGWASHLQMFCSSAAQSELNTVFWPHVACCFFFLSLSFPVSLCIFSLFCLFHSLLCKTKITNTVIIFNLQLSNLFHFQHLLKSIAETVEHFLFYFLLLNYELDSKWTIFLMLLNCPYKLGDDGWKIFENIS